MLFNLQVYYVLAIVEDLIFRALWTLNISVGEAGAGFLQGDILGTILATMEVFRRFVWNFFRLENEHLNNAGEFRVVRDIAVVPLDLTQLPKENEEEGGGAEQQLREHFQFSKRRISNALVEVRRLISCKPMIDCTIVCWIFIPSLSLSLSPFLPLCSYHMSRMAFVVEGGLIGQAHPIRLLFPGGRTALIAPQQKSHW